MTDPAPDALRTPVAPVKVDCHVHLTGGGGEGGFATRVPPLALSAFTRNGTTSAVGVLGTAREFGDQGCLARAGFADDEDRLALAGQGVGQKRP